MNKTIHFIINPKSGAKKNNNILPLIEKHISNKWEVETHLTRHAGHGRLIASYLAKEGAYMIVAVGGDGSVNEIASSLVDHDTLLGIIPTGSGNGFAHHFNIPENLVAALKLIDNGNHVLSDIGKINEQYFASNVGIGLDALVAKKFKFYHSRGFWSYIKIATSQYFKFNPINTKIIVDGAELIIENALLISVANTSEFGNRFQIAPNNSHADGQLELVIFTKPPLLILPFTLFRFFTKKIRNSNYVSHQLTSNITFQKFDHIQKDGDWLDTDMKEVKLSVHEQCLKVVC